MFNVGDWTAALTNLFLFCAAHPWLAFPLAFSLSIYIAVDLSLRVHETIIKFYELVGPRRFAAAAGSLVPFGLVLTVIIARVSFHFGQAVPLIITPGGHILTHDFVIRWTYSRPEDQMVLFDTIIWNRDKHSKTETRTSLPYEHVREQGNLTIEVDALLADGTRLRSSPLVVEVYVDSVERIKSKGELVAAVHTDDSDGLFCFQPADSFQYEGFDIDFVRKIAESLASKYRLSHLKVKFIYEQWPDVIFQPTKFNVDLAIASITINADREHEVDFSSPYLETTVAVIQNRDLQHGGDGDFQLRDFDGLKVGVHEETTAQILVEKIRKIVPNVSPIVASDNQELFSMLADGKVDVVVYDSVVYDSVRTRVEQQTHFSWLVRNINYASLKAAGIAWSSEQYGISFAKINKQLKGDVDTLLRNGELRPEDLLNARLNVAAALKDTQASISAALQ